MKTPQDYTDITKAEVQKHGETAPKTKAKTTNAILPNVTKSKPNVTTYHKIGILKFLDFIFTSQNERLFRPFTRRRVTKLKRK